MPRPALAVDGLTKRFGSGPNAVTAIEDVSFTVERGSVVGLLGPNGAGKTTTIKSILRMVLPDAGDVRVFGTGVASHPRTAYDRVDAMLEGARNDYWRLTVRENLRYFAIINGVDPDAIASRHERLFERLDPADRADEPVRNLSRGMKQKVSLASVLAGSADLVFPDEPTLGLAVESSLALREELRRVVAERGTDCLLGARTGLRGRRRRGTVQAHRQLAGSHPVRVRPAHLRASVRPRLGADAPARPRERAPPGAMVEGTRLWAFPLADLVLLALLAAGYLLFGYVVFQLATQRARRLGVLDDY